MEQECLRRRVKEKSEELGERDLAWLNRMNTAGIHTGCFCQECGKEIALLFYEEGVGIACHIDGTPTVKTEDIQKFTNILKGAKVAVEVIEKEGEKTDEGKTEDELKMFETKSQLSVVETEGEKGFKIEISGGRN